MRRIPARFCWSAAPADHAIGWSLGGLTTKVHALTVGADRRQRSRQTDVRRAHGGVM